MSTGKMQDAVLTVSGMGCAACANRIEKALKSKNGVAQALVSLADGKARVTFDGSLISLDDIKAAIEATGYKVESATQQ